MKQLADEIAMKEEKGNGFPNRYKLREMETERLWPRVVRGMGKVKGNRCV